MDIRECYHKLDGDFENAMRRLGSENFIRRFTIRFLSDPSFQMIKDGISAGDAELAFRGAHTLKGVCANLDFTRLQELSAQLTEVLRERKLEGYEEIFSAVERQYQQTVAAIKELDQ